MVSRHAKIAYWILLLLPYSCFCKDYTVTRASEPIAPRAAPLEAAQKNTEKAKEVPAISQEDQIKVSLNDEAKDESSSFTSSDRRKHKKKEKKQEDPIVKATTDRLYAELKELSPEQVKIATAKKESKKLIPVKLTSKDKRKKKRATKTGRISVSDMEFEDIYVLKNEKIKAKDFEGAIRYIEKMLPLSKDAMAIRDIMIELADLLLLTNALDKAGKIYLDFIKLYPGDKAIEYAYYRAIVCSFNAILDPQRDQSNTKDTLELINKYLDRADLFRDHTQAILAMQIRCLEVLAESEFNIIDFYVKQGNFKAVQNRLDGLKNGYVHRLPNLETQILLVELDVANKRDDKDLAQNILAKLETKSPNQLPATVLADNKKSSFKDRF